MSNQLPQLSSMILPAFLTLRRSSKITEKGIQTNKTFKAVEIEEEHLNAFKAYFDFSTNVPLTYIYTIAQRAQTALMLDKHFTLPIPGMVHIENQLTQKSELDPYSSFDVTSSAFVAYEESDSLKPTFEVELVQNGHVVATCRSIYTVKRKDKKQKIRKKALAPLQQAKHQELWNVNAKTGKEYASISGDKNPIHTSLIFAKMLGFKTQIMHGWYSVCKIEQFLEGHYNQNVSDISVKFLSPVLLPSQPKFLLQQDENKAFNYQLVNHSNARILLTGKMK
ncbi:MAG: hypothetical protein CL843_16205 [Crocinitomicaceae bacterium]|nr:hypothetical protein [Crocinitomicaceae bacterium]|tara:strand:- start:2766 stop:3605 length:840 start_codon:yes stop_codon:yes gene_type:complete